MNQKNLRKFINLGTLAVLSFNLIKPQSVRAITFSTQDNPLGSGSNQGWWNSNGSHSTGNDNYYTGISGSLDYNSYFIFDISSLNNTVTSATLNLQRYTTDVNAEIEFFDVSTNANTLENDSTNISIYNDLETGNSYGSFTISNSGNVGDVLSFTLNSNAINDINNNTENYFAIGGNSINGVLFSSSNSSTLNTLELETSSSSVPFEFSPTLGLFIIGGIFSISILNKSLKFYSKINF